MQIPGSEKNLDFFGSKDFRIAEGRSYLLESEIGDYHKPQLVSDTKSAVDKANSLLSWISESSELFIREQSCSIQCNKQNLSVKGR